EGGQANRKLYFDERELVRAADQRKVQGPERDLATQFKATDKQRVNLFKQIDTIESDDKLSAREKDSRVKVLKEKELELMLGARRALERARAKFEKRPPTFEQGGSVPLPKRRPLRSIYEGGYLLKPETEYQPEPSLELRRQLAPFKASPVEVIETPPEKP